MSEYEIKKTNHKMEIKEEKIFLEDKLIIEMRLETTC